MSPLRRRRVPHALIVVQNLPVPFDRRVWLEAQALRDDGWHVSVVCPAGEGQAHHERLDGIDIHRYPPPPGASGLLSYALEYGWCWLRTTALVLRVQARRRIDVVQACNPPDTYWLLAALLRPLGVRFVYDQHDLCPEVYLSRFGRGPDTLHRVLLWLERASYRTADHVISTNDSYRDIARTRGNLSPDAVTVVRNGPDPGRLHPVPPSAELRMGRLYLCCYLGVMNPQDGVDVLLRAAYILIHEMGRVDIHFALLGFGDALEALQALSTTLGLDDHVTFTGRADDDMIRRYLSTADVGLSPDPVTSFNDLSTMNKTMEYMAFELPVVAFQLRETRVSAGEAAVYVDHCTPKEYAKAVAALLDAPDERARRGAIGFQEVTEHLAWPHQARHYLSVYRRLMPASARRGERRSEGSPPDGHRRVTR